MPPKKAGQQKPQKLWIGIDTQGEDNSGKKFQKSIQDWWKDYEKETAANASEAPAQSEATVAPSRWYSVAKSHWGGVAATLDGVLGGFASVHDADVAYSKKFMLPFFDGSNTFNIRLQPNRVIDMGAGIGRVSVGLLATLYKTVDVLEQNPEYVEKAKADLGALKSIDPALPSPLGTAYCAALQDFKFPKGVKYDTIWIQWVLLYLVDTDLVAFLKRCKEALTNHGLIVVKENLSKDGYYIDNQDSSITRSPAHFKQIFQAAGLKVLKEEPQDFPPELNLLPIRMYALK